MTRHQSRRQEGRDELRYEFSFPEYDAGCYPAGGLLTLSNTEHGPVVDLWRVDPCIEVRVAHEDPKTGRPTAQDRLIAAAPELLEALKALCEQEDWEGEDIQPGTPIWKARAAIAKAEGGSNVLD